MEVQCLPSDIISTLPRNIIEMILSLLPIRDAVRTSILSRKWRYIWVNIPRLVFDDNMFEGLNSKELFLSKIFCAIYQVLLMHRGPILELTFCMGARRCSKIDQIILHLSRNNTVQKFTLDTDCEVTEKYMLPSSFFSLQRLTHLTLRLCEFKPPLTFNGFSMLTSLYMNGVSITDKTLLHLFSNCPLLKSLSLIESETRAGGEDYDIVELFECLPAIEHLFVSFDDIECFTAGGVPRKLPTLLVNLKSVTFSDLYFMKQKELDFAHLVISSSPNLEKIKMQIYHHHYLSYVWLFEVQDYSDVWLDHLNELAIENFTNTINESEFLKCVLAKSPMLKKVRIELDSKVSVDEELKMLRSFLCLPRASPVVQIIVEPR